MEQPNLRDDDIPIAPDGFKMEVGAGAIQPDLFNETAGRMHSISSG